VWRRAARLSVDIYSRVNGQRGFSQPNGAPWPTQYVIAMGGYSAMTGTETISKSAAVWAVRRGANRRRAGERLASRGVVYEVAKPNPD